MMKKLSALIFALTLTAALHTENKLTSPIDEIMRKAFWDSKKPIASTQSFQQKDRHKRTVTASKNDYTVTVEFDYKTAPTEIKKAAEEIIKAEDAKAESKGWSWKSPLLPEIIAALMLDPNTRTQCTMHWKRNKEDESKITCTLTATFAELSKK